MAPTPDPDSRQVVATPRVRPVLFVALSLLIAGVGVGLFFAFNQEEESSPPVADDLASALADARPASEPFGSLTEVALAVGDDCVRLLVADDEAERGAGLRGVTDLGPYDGMLFVNEADVTSAYTMSGVTEPLDIGWYDAGGGLVSRTAMEPCPEGGPECPLYSADGPYRFALETPPDELPSGALGGCPS